VAWVVKDTTTQKNQGIDAFDPIEKR